MKLSELMENRTPDPTYKGKNDANDMVLAVDFSDSGSVDEYFVAQTQITEHSGSLDAETQDSQYIRTGKSTSKTGTSRVITLNGEAFTGDDFQDAILAHGIKYGKGSEVVKNYVYFNIRSGKGEKGSVTIVVDTDAGGQAGETLTFSATLSSTEEPQEYTYKSSGA